MIKQNILSKVNVTTAIQFSVLATVAVSAPLFQNQLISGSLVNATLFIAASTLNIEGAILICLLPSLIALGVGTLPLALAPLLPYIMISNILLVITYIYLKNLNYWFKIITASILKFIFLFSISSLVVNLLFPKILATNLLIMMSWPQLLTALIGGGLAYSVVRNNKKNI